jgi:hypothetical protein
MIYKRLIVLLGILLSSLVPMSGQTPPPRIALSRDHFAPITTMLRTVSTPLPATSFLLYQDLGKSSARFSYRFAGANEIDPGMELLPQIKEVKTFLYTQSSLPLVQLWSGRLQLDAFQSTLHIQNVQLGPLAYGNMQGFRSQRQGYPGGLPSVHFSSVSLTIHFGRDVRTGRPTQEWRRLSRIVATVLN